MPDFLGNQMRRGGSGRIPDKERDKHKLYQKVNISLDPDTFDRLEKYCIDEERARSWVIQKAVAAWLDSKGY